MQLRLTRFAVMTALFLAIAGCGGDQSRGKIHGKITYQGKNITNTMVIFLASDNSTYPTDLNPDGTYKVDGVPYGVVKVSIQQMPARSASRPQMGIPKAATGGGGEAKDSTITEAPAEPKQIGPVLPPIYSDAKSSNLQVELKQPDLEWSVDLK